MNLRLRNTVFPLFFAFICFHFLISSGSHLHLCWNTFDVKLCTLDEEEYRIEHILHHHFHQKGVDSDSSESLSKKPSTIEKHIHLTFLSSGNNLKAKVDSPQEDFIPQYYILSFIPKIVQFTPLIAMFSPFKSFRKYHTPRSPPFISII